MPGARRGGHSAKGTAGWPCALGNYPGSREFHQKAADLHGGYQGLGSETETKGLRGGSSWAPRWNSRTNYGYTLELIRLEVQNQGRESEVGGCRRGWDSQSRTERFMGPEAEAWGWKAAMGREKNLAGREA